MWWECDKIKDFWDTICNELKKMFKISFPKIPEAFLLGLMTPEIQKKYRPLFMYASTAARILIEEKGNMTSSPQRLNGKPH